MGTESLFDDEKNQTYLIRSFVQSFKTSNLNSHVGVVEKDKTYSSRILAGEKKCGAFK